MSNTTGYITSGPKSSDYTKYSILSFPDWRTLAAFAQEVKDTRQNSEVEQANANFKIYVNRILANPNSTKLSSFGLFGKAPKNYDEAMARDTFLYYDEYKHAKEKVEKIIADKLQKDSTAEVMRPKFVFNDKQIGEFIYEKAGMSLQPEIYYYSFVHKREVDIIKERVIQDGNVMILASDRSIVVYALRVEKEDGTVVFLEIKGEKTLAEASALGIVDCTSSNKKVYLYKEKLPKFYKSVKIIVGMTAGGFTHWENDFYTGLTACIVVDVLESLGYSVDVEVVLGGGRCGGCYRKLNFDGEFIQGRRFFTFTAKSFNEQLDLDGLLYTLCDPSFHNVKFISLLNYFFSFFGDQIDANRGFNGRVLSADADGYGNPNSTWHGIETQDMINPIGMYLKQQDFKKGNKDMLHFYIHKVPQGNVADGEDVAQGVVEPEKDIMQGVVSAVMDIVLTCENKNLESLKKMNDGFDKENNN